MKGAAELRLQTCDDCGTVQYPAREVCRRCLGGSLTPRPVEPQAKILSWTRLHASLDPWFRERLPWTIVSVELLAGPVALAHWAGDDEPVIGQLVNIAQCQDHAERQVLVALPTGADPNAALRLFEAARQ